MSSDTANQAFRRAAGEGQPLSIFGLVKASSAETGGTLEVFELTGRQGPPPHIHRDHDECFYIVKGQLTFVLGDEQVDALEGSVVFIPRGTRHGFKPSEGARALVFVIPGGLEGFFRELGEGILAHRSEADLRDALAGKYDSEPAA